MLIEAFFLFLGFFVKKMRSPQLLIENKDMGMFLKEERRSNEVLRAKKGKNEEPKKCTIGHALRYNNGKTWRFQS